VIALALLLTTAAAAAPTSTPHIDLSWEAPGTCPKSDDIERDVRRILGDATMPSNLRSIAAQATLSENPDGSFELVLRTRAASQERERSVRVDGCESARALVAFLLAMLVDPNARPRNSEPAKDAEAPRAPPLPREEPRQQPHEQGHGLRAVTSLLGAADIGTLPYASPGAELRIGLWMPSWLLEARAVAFWPRDAASRTVAGAGGEFRLLEAGVLGCRVSATKPSFAACAGPALLTMRGRAFGVTDAEQASAVWVAASAEGAALFPVSSVFALRAMVGALVSIQRPTFAIRGLGSVHRPGLIAARMGLGLQVRF
jgi:hypothetical protein